MWTFCRRTITTPPKPKQCNTTKDSNKVHIPFLQSQSVVFGAALYWFDNKMLHSTLWILGLAYFSRNDPLRLINSKQSYAQVYLPTTLSPSLLQNTYTTKLLSPTNKLCSLYEEQGNGGSNVIITNHITCVILTVYFNLIF